MFDNFYCSHAGGGEFVEEHLAGFALEDGENIGLEFKCGFTFFTYL